MNTSYYIADPAELIVSIDCQNNDYSGYIIQTTKQTIKFLISTDQLCCEDSDVRFGYPVDNNYPNNFMSDDDIQNFKDTNLLSIKMIDEEYVTDGYNDKEGSIMRFLIKTSTGDFHMCVYNIHNGYYSHEYIINYGSYSDTDRI